MIRLDPQPGEVYSVGPFDVDHPLDEPYLSVRHINLGFGYEEDASLVLVIRRISFKDPMDGSKVWKVLILHRTGELRVCDRFRFPAIKCERVL